MEISDLIDYIVENGRLEDKKVVKILTECIKKKKCDKHIFKCLYKEAYGDELIPVLCEEIISKMENEEKSGSIWSLEDVESVIKKLEIDIDSKPYTLSELRAAMTMEYYEHNIPLKKCGVNMEQSGWCKLADYALTKEPDKLVQYYFHLL